MSIQQEVADRLAQLRREKSAHERRDILQGEIAEKVGIGSENYSRYENGKRKIPDPVLIALADYFGVSPGFLRYGDRDFGLVQDAEAPPAEAKVSKRNRAT